MKNTTTLKRPTLEIVNRFDELEAMISARKESISQEIYQEHSDLIHDYDWLDVEFEENGKRGLKNVKGEVLVPAIYDDFASLESYFLPSLPVAAIKDGKRLLVKRDGSGDPVTEAKYAHIKRIAYSAIYAVSLAENEDRYALMVGGEVITPYEIERCYGLVDGCIILEADGKYGVLAVEQGLVYIAPEYDEVCDQGVGDDFLFVKDGVEGFVTLDKRFISKAEYANLDVDAQDELYEVGFIGCVF